MFVTDKPFSTSMIYFDENSRRSHDIQHNDSQHKHNEDSNKKIRHSVSILMQSITVLSATIKSIMLSVVMVNVVASSRHAYFSKAKFQLFLFSLLRIFCVFSRVGQSYETF